MERHAFHDTMLPRLSPLEKAKLGARSLRDKNICTLIANQKAWVRPGPEFEREIWIWLILKHDAVLACLLHTIRILIAWR